VEHYPAIRVRDFKEALRSSASARRWPSFCVFEGKWRIAGEEIRATITAKMNEIEISFADPTQFFGCTIGLAHRQRGFGGRRAFLLCPGCSKDRTALYIRRGLIRCRVCTGLKHVSQTRDPSSRQHDAIRKLRARLDENGERPKRMRRRTYEALCVKINTREEMIDRLWAPREAELFRRLGVGSRVELRVAEADLLSRSTATAEKRTYARTGNDPLLPVRPSNCQPQS
jgi:hypothetical protein